MENLNLPQEIKHHVLQYLQRDKNMTSKLSEFMRNCAELNNFRKLKFDICFGDEIIYSDDVPEEEREYDDPDMTYYEYYFKHGFNHEYKYTQRQYFDFLRYR